MHLHLVAHLQVREVRLRGVADQADAARGVGLEAAFVGGDAAGARNTEKGMGEP